MSDTEVAKPGSRRSQILLFPSDTRTTDGEKDTSAATLATPVLTRGATALVPHIIEIERLYDAPSGESYKVVKAIDLLKEVTGWLSEARDCEDTVEADQYVQRVQMTLPRLFALRSIGDGFGVIINSLNNVFVNLRGTPLNRDQVAIVWRVLRELRAHPILSLEQGVRHIEELEQCGLQVDPPEVGELLDGLQSMQNA